MGAGSADLAGPGAGWPALAVGGRDDEALSVAEFCPFLTERKLHMGSIIAFVKQSASYPSIIAFVKRSATHCVASVMDAHLTWCD